MDIPIHPNNGTPNGSHSPRSRNVRPCASLASPLSQLETLVGWESLWRMVEQFEAFHNSAPNRSGTRRQYRFVDIVVTAAATQLRGSTRQAVLELSDTWQRLRRAAAAAFPTDPTRRLSQHAPSRHQYHRACRDFFVGDALGELKRALRAETVAAAEEIGMFNPRAGTWTHPDRSQVVVGDATRLHAKTSPPGGSHRAPVRELVMISARCPHNGERVVLDAHLAQDRSSSSDAEEAVAMLERLLGEHGQNLQGLRGFAYDMAMTPRVLDKVLDLGVLPITAVPTAPGGAPGCVNLGSHTFTAPDGTPHSHDVIAFNGSPAVTLTDRRGDAWIVALDRQRIKWTRNGRRCIASGRYAIPADSAVPAPLRGAVTTIRFNSNDNEIGNGTRRTRALRPIPADDPAFAVYGERNDAEAVVGDLKRRPGHTFRTEFSVVTYQMLHLANALARYRQRTR